METGKWKRKVVNGWKRAAGETVLWIFGEWWGRRGFLVGMLRMEENGGVRMRMYHEEGGRGARMVVVFKAEGFLFMFSGFF